MFVGSIVKPQKFELQYFADPGISSCVRSREKVVWLDR